MAKEHTIFGTDFDGGTLDQFYSALDQPFTVKGALMPDGHLGYSLPIGAVMATDGVIVPAWVGYDIGCTDMDTEYLTETGWKKISDYNNEKIAVYDLEKDQAKFEHPNAFIVNDCDEFKLIDNGVVNQALTDDHRVLLFGERTDYPRTDTLSNWMAKNNELGKGVTHRFKSTIPMADSALKLDMTDDELRLLIAISADGCIRKSGAVEFHLKKQRKIDRLLRLLGCLNIIPTVYKLKTDAFACSIKFIGATKDLSCFWSASNAQLSVLIDEVTYWDGHIAKEKGTIAYSSTLKGNVDVVQYGFAVHGIRANYHTTQNTKEGWATGYTLYTTKNDYIGFPAKRDIKTVKAIDGKSYCFNTSTGYWVMRRKGRIAITGNCGVCAFKTTLSLRTVLMNRAAIFKEICRSVPVGKGVYSKRPVVWNAYSSIDKTKVVHELFRDHGGLKHLSTLGSGNHFIEIGADQEEKIWIIVHSGSRGIGYKTAQHYMKLASGDGKAREGHFGFDVETQNGKDYIKDLNFCLEFALENRKQILWSVYKVLAKACTGEDTAKYESLLFTAHPALVTTSPKFVNRHHNHAELKDGLWIHRKGATHAEDGMMGVIPGNMRDGSFIVQGKGNPDSLWSSSHGAGRALSRSKAKAELTVESFEKQMVGVVAKVGKSTLDEAPDAYKDIFKVMGAQTDLVDVIHRVRPIINVKG